MDSQTEELKKNLVCHCCQKPLTAKPIKGDKFGGFLMEKAFLITNIEKHMLVCSTCLGLLKFLNFDWT